MTRRQKILAYANHLALNLGVASEALLWAMVPPWIGHTEAQLQDLSNSNPFHWYAWGANLTRKPGAQ